MRLNMLKQSYKLLREDKDHLFNITFYEAQH